MLQFASKISGRFQVPTCNKTADIISRNTFKFPISSVAVYKLQIRSLLYTHCF